LNIYIKVNENFHVYIKVERKFWDYDILAKLCESREFLQIPRNVGEIAQNLVLRNFVSTLVLGFSHDKIKIKETFL
jgi:hypothetical protein